ncbi:MAG: nucleoside recognition protein [Archaeoglobus sp.]|uniref:nucleoside recognition domain-containing protein n=1 Tax=Archaeoglobus sp. TaxID=1872626 RepID=UPI001D6AED15|nr:nucleoside recognition domain-containing protein [Archaeoglobus sp.]MBO8179952.1 nucleoside recognition protein [Archaeoglobus sp.]
MNEAYGISLITHAATLTAIFLIKTLPVVIVAIYAVSYSIKKGYLEKFAFSLQPALRKFGVSEFAVISFATCFISPTASYSMLSQVWREKKIDDREVIAVSFLNSFPSVFSHLYAFFIPFVIPVLGFAGLVYTGIRFAVAIIKSLIGFFLSRRWNHSAPSYQELKPVSVSQNVLRIAAIMGITYFIVSLLSLLGVFDFMSEALKFLPFKAEAITIAIVEFFNVRSAVVTAAGFMDSGLEWKWVVTGLILGNVISFSTRSVKHSLPMHLSLFGQFGVKIVLLNSIVTLILDIAFVVLLLII